MAKVFIDTSIVIDHLRLKDKTKTILYRLFQDKHDLFASILTHTESYAGKSIWEKESARTHLKDVLSGIKILPLEDNISEKAGEISAKYNLEIIDALIAATALSNKLPLVTLNTKDLERVKGLTLWR